MAVRLLGQAADDAALLPFEIEKQIVRTLQKRPLTLLTSFGYRHVGKGRFVYWVQPEAAIPDIVVRNGEVPASDLPTALMNYVYVRHVWGRAAS